MIRWISLFLLSAGPALAESWHCDHALMPSPISHEIETFSFSLELKADGQFAAQRIRDKDSLPRWSWQGHWTLYENEIVMIGTTEAERALRFTPQAGLSQRELRAHSAWVAQDVILFNVITEGDAKLVRCLSEGL